MMILKKIVCLIFGHKMDTRVEKDESGCSSRVKLLDLGCLRCDWLTPVGTPVLYVRCQTCFNSVAYKPQRVNGLNTPEGVIHTDDRLTVYLTCEGGHTHPYMVWVN